MTAPAWFEQAVAWKDQRSLREIADTLEVPVEVVARTFLDRGVTRTPPDRSSSAGSLPSTDGATTRVEDLVDLLGNVPDRVIAAMADVSIPTVRNHRLRRDIDASGRIHPEEIEQRLAAWRESQASGGARSTQRPRAWRISFHGEGRRQVVLASNLQEAVQTIHRSVADPRLVRGLEDLGEVIASEG